MFRKFLSLVLVGLLLQIAWVIPASANTKEEKKTRQVEKVKSGIAKLGVGEEARIKVKLHNGTKLDGYIREVGNEHFIIVDAKSGEATPVAYPQVARAKGNNLSTGARVAIGIAVVAAIFTIIVLAGRS